MRRFNVLIAGLVTAACGGYLIFANPETLPLWFVWLAGPFLWYAGIALSIVGAAVVLFAPRSRQKVLEQTKKQDDEPERILHLREFAVETPPVHLVREIPAMGGFIM